MKNKIKFLGLIALVAIMGFTFVACGGGGGSSDSTIPGPQNLRVQGGIPDSGTVHLRWDAVDGAGDYDYKIYRNGVISEEGFDYGANKGFSPTGLTEFVSVNFEVSAMIGEKETQRSFIRVMLYPVGSRTHLPLGNNLVSSNISANGFRAFGVAGNAVNDAGNYQIGLANSGFPLDVYLMNNIYQLVDTRYRGEIRYPAANFPAVRIPEGEYGIVVRNTSSSAVDIEIGIQRLGD